MSNVDQANGGNTDAGPVEQIRVAYRKQEFAQAATIIRKALDGAASLLDIDD